MKRARVILYGLGKDYLEYRDELVKKVDIIAVSDSNNRETKIDKYISPDEITNYDVDYVLITSRKYYESIRLRLVQLGLHLSKIKSLNEILKIHEKRNYIDDIIRDKNLYTKLNTDPEFEIREDQLMIIETDKGDSAGKPCSHYFAQDIWAAKKIHDSAPKNHYDIGSRLDGFIAHLLCFREVEYIDIRPLPYRIQGLKYSYGNAMDLIDFQDNSIESLSCLSALEHFGLGRYGDPIDPEGYIKAIREIQRVVKPGGKIYISVPVGPKNKCVFNAHRIFRINTIIELFDKCKCSEIKLVAPTGVIAEKVSKSKYNEIEEFSCALFEFIKY